MRSVQWYGMVWYGIVEFNVPLDTVQAISETGGLSSDVHLTSHSVMEGQRHNNP